LLSQIHFPFFSFAFMSYKNSETKKLRKGIFLHLQLLKYISRFSEYVIKSFILLIARCSEFLSILVFTGLKLKKEIKNQVFVLQRVYIFFLNFHFPQFTQFHIPFFVCFSRQKDISLPYKF